MNSLSVKMDRFTVSVLSTAFTFLLLLTSCSSNRMDPHVYPDEGPFFEGWYMRITDSAHHVTLGFLFGLVLPKPGTEDPNTPVAIATILLSEGLQGRLDSPTGHFSLAEYSVTQDGQPVDEDPDASTPPHFEANITSNLSFVVTPTGTTFSVTVGDHRLTGSTSKPVPWGPGGEGPESWLQSFPLPLHWFVYSLRSTVDYYRYENIATGKVIEGGASHGGQTAAHLEKNWGDSFPKAWVWSEGVDPTTNVSFAISAGLLTLSLVDITSVDMFAQLSGYRNPAKGIRCNFHPDNTLSWLFHHDGCAGTATLDVESLDCRVIFSVYASPGTFSTCLLAPVQNGFEKACVESFSAVAEITVYQGLGFRKVLKDKETINMAALEFGLQYMCNSMCPPE